MLTQLRNQLAAIDQQILEQEKVIKSISEDTSEEFDVRFLQIKNKGDLPALHKLVDLYCHSAYLLLETEALQAEGSQTKDPQKLMAIVCRFQKAHDTADPIELYERQPQDPHPDILIPYMRKYFGKFEDQFPDAETFKRNSNYLEQIITSSALRFLETSGDLIPLGLFASLLIITYQGLLYRLNHIGLGENASDIPGLNPCEVKSIEDMEAVLNGLRRSIAKCFFQWGERSLGQDDLINARNELKQAITIIFCVRTTERTPEDRCLLANCFNKLIGSFALEGNEAEALKYCQEAINIFKDMAEDELTIEDFQNLSKLHKHLVVFLASQGKLAEAKNHSKIAEEFQQKISDKKKLLESTSFNQHHEDQTEEKPSGMLAILNASISSFEKTIVVIARHPDQNLLPSIFSSGLLRQCDFLSNICFQGIRNSAEDVRNRESVRNIAQRLQNTLDIANGIPIGDAVVKQQILEACKYPLFECYRKCGESLAETGDYKEAIDYLKRAIALAPQRLPQKQKDKLNNMLVFCQGKWQKDNDSQDHVQDQEKTAYNRAKDLISRLILSRKISPHDLEHKIVSARCGFEVGRALMSTDEAKDWPHAVTTFKQNIEWLESIKESLDVTMQGYLAESRACLVTTVIKLGYFLMERKNAESEKTYIENLQTAKSYYDEAIPHAEQMATSSDGGDKNKLTLCLCLRDSANCRKVLGEVLMQGKELKDVDTAILLFNESIDRAKKAIEFLNQRGMRETDFGCNTIIRQCQENLARCAPPLQETHQTTAGASILETIRLLQQVESDRAKQKGSGQDIPPERQRLQETEAEKLARLEAKYKQAEDSNSKFAIAACGVELGDALNNTETPKNWERAATILRQCYEYFKQTSMEGQNSKSDEYQRYLSNSEEYLVLVITHLAAFFMKKKGRENLEKAKNYFDEVFPLCVSDKYVQQEKIVYQYLYLRRTAECYIALGEELIKSKELKDVEEATSLFQAANTRIHSVVIFFKNRQQKQYLECSAIYNQCQEKLKMCSRAKQEIHAATAQRAAQEAAAAAFSPARSDRAGQKRDKKTKPRPVLADTSQPVVTVEPTKEALRKELTRLTLKEFLDYAVPRKELQTNLEEVLGNCKETTKKCKKIVAQYSESTSATVSPEELLKEIAGLDEGIERCIKSVRELSSPSKDTSSIPASATSSTVPRQPDEIFAREAQVVFETTMRRCKDTERLVNASILLLLQDPEKASTASVSGRADIGLMKVTRDIFSVLKKSYGRDTEYDGTKVAFDTTKGTDLKSDDKGVLQKKLEILKHHNAHVTELNSDSESPSDEKKRISDFFTHLLPVVQNLLTKLEASQQEEIARKANLNKEEQEKSTRLWLQKSYEEERAKRKAKLAEEKTKRNQDRQQRLQREQEEKLAADYSEISPQEFESIDLAKITMTISQLIERMQIALAQKSEYSESTIVNACQSYFLQMLEAAKLRTCGSVREKFDEWRNWFLYCVLSTESAVNKSDFYRQNVSHDNAKIWEDLTKISIEDFYKPPFCIISDTLSNAHFNWDQSSAENCKEEIRLLVQEICDLGKTAASCTARMDSTDCELSSTIQVAAILNLRIRIRARLSTLRNIAIDKTNLRESNNAVEILTIIGFIDKELMTETSHAFFRSSVKLGDAFAHGKKDLSLSGDERATLLKNVIKGKLVAQRALEKFNTWFPQPQSQQQSAKSLSTTPLQSVAGNRYMTNRFPLPPAAGQGASKGRGSEEDTKKL